MPTDAYAVAVRGENAGKDLVLITKVLVYGIGEVVARISSEAAHGAGEAAGPFEADKFLRTVDGQHAQENLVKEGEDRGVGADAKREGDDHGEREGR